MKINEMVDGPTLDWFDPLARNRSDDPVEVRLSVKLRDGRTFEAELPKGVRPTVELTIDRDWDTSWFEYGEARPFGLVSDSVRIVVEASTRDGRAEDDGCLFRFTVQELEGVQP
jgi:hypothetical protein